MRLLAATGCLALGVALAIRLLAALYALLDLWRLMGSLWPRVLGALLFWTALTAALMAALSPLLRGALAAGLAGYVLFYLSLFPLRDRWLRGRRSRPA